MKSVKAVQPITTVYAYCGRSEGAVLIKSVSPTLPFHTSDLKYCTSGGVALQLRTRHLYHVLLKIE